LQLKLVRMQLNFLLGNSMKLVKKPVPVQFEPIEVPIIVNSEIIYGKLVPTEFMKGIRYIPINYMEGEVAR